MIGRRCKARERLSRAPLIGRALRDTQSVPSAPDRSQASPSSSAVRPPGRPCASPSRRSPRRNAPRGPAATAAGAHPDPYRTRKLSRPAPMVLQGRPCGRLGRRRPPGRVARARGGEAQKRHLGEGTREGPLFRLRAFPARREGRRAAGPLGGQAAFSRSGPLARPSRVTDGLLHVADPRRVFSAGRGSEGGLRFDALGVRCLRPAPCLAKGAVPAREALPAGSSSGCPISPGSRFACSRGLRTCIKA